MTRTSFHKQMPAGRTNSAPDSATSTCHMFSYLAGFAIHFKKCEQHIIKIPSQALNIWILRNSCSVALHWHLLELGYFILPNSSHVLIILWAIRISRIARHKFKVREIQLIQLIKRYQKGNWNYAVALWSLYLYHFHEIYKTGLRAPV